MSAINQHPSRIDRAGELRVDQESLNQLWSKAKILQISEGRIAAVGREITFFSADEVASKVSSNLFAEGSRYFLGLDSKSREPFFAWDTHWQENLTDEEKAIGFSTVREIGAFLQDRELELGLHALALSNWHRAPVMQIRANIIHEQIQQ